MCNAFPLDNLLRAVEDFLVEMFPVCNFRGAADDLFFMFQFHNIYGKERRPKRKTAAVGKKIT